MRDILSLADALFRKSESSLSLSPFFGVGMKRARRELNPRPTDFFAVFGLRVRRSSLTELRARGVFFCEGSFVWGFRGFGWGFFGL